MAFGPVTAVDEHKFASREDCVMYMNHRYSNAVIYTFDFDCLPSVEPKVRKPRVRREK